jgi:hypothetical protein
MLGKFRVVIFLRSLRVFPRLEWRRRLRDWRRARLDQGTTRLPQLASRTAFIGCGHFSLPDRGRRLPPRPRVTTTARSPSR